MSQTKYTDSYVSEGTLSGESTLTFPWPLLHVQLTNDSSTEDLQVKLNTTETYRTLKPKETMELEGMSLFTMTLSGSGPYRLWGLG